MPNTCHTTDGSWPRDSFAEELRDVLARVNRIIHPTFPRQPWCR
jgi:hypothetical protein